MELQDLSGDERVVAIALFDKVIQADRAGSPGEARRVASLAAAFGDEEYQRILGEEQVAVESEDDLWGLVAKVTNQDSRDLIYGKLMECAFEGGLEKAESACLEKLRNLWDINVEAVEPPKEDS